MHTHKKFIKGVGTCDFLACWGDYWLKLLRRSLMEVSFKWKLEGKKS